MKEAQFTTFNITPSDAVLKDEVRRPEGPPQPIYWAWPNSPEYWRKDVRYVDGQYHGPK